MVASQLFGPDEWIKMNPQQIGLIVVRLQAEMLHSETVRGEMQKVARTMVKK
jgi:hypothetical protein